MTIALAKRSFSKLKILKTYLKPSMPQKKLNVLVILCIKKDKLENINIDVIINNFASKNI